MAQELQGHEVFDSPMLTCDVLKSVRYAAQTIVGTDYADDVVQDFALRVVQGKIVWTDGTAKPKTFAVHIGKNLALNMRKRLNIQARIMPQIIDGQDAPIEDRATVQRNKLAAIDAVYKAGDTRQRQIIDGLKEGYTTAQIAERLSMPHATVRTVIRRLRLKVTGK